MLSNHPKKNRINLKDYNYQHDIRHRLLISQFSIFEVDVLEEILNSSLNFHISELIEYLDTDIFLLKPVLEKFKNADLLQFDNDYNITVDKKMRKYYEFQLSKFDDDFKPDIEFLQKLLNKIPIQFLPSWYLIPRSSDNIFQSIIDKYFITPQIYERYLKDLKFDDPILKSIMGDVFDAPNLKIRSKEIREKYYLSRDEFEEYMLHLEFNFVCCLSYTRDEEENGWHEVVTPFYEWKKYLIFKKENQPQEIPEKATIYQEGGIAFAFVADAKMILKTIKKTPLELSSQSSFVKQVPSSATLKSIIKKSESQTENSEDKQLHYFSYIISKLCVLGIAENKNGKLIPCQDTDAWLEMNNEDFAIHIYKHPDNTILKTDVPSNLSSSHQNFREIEKGLKKLYSEQWYLCDDFVNFLTESIGESQAVSLKKIGRNWQYAIPQYSDDEKKFVKAALMENLFEAGLVDIGKYKDRECFRITPFGQIIFES